jgi:SAM-dependent methyltransferase
MSLTQQDVVRLYQILLQRNPESQAVADGVIARFDNAADVVEWIARSSEFSNRQADAARQILRKNQDIPTMDVQTDCDKPSLELLLERVAQTFSEYGVSDPYWSVLTNDRFRMDQVDANMKEFFETGRQSAELLTHALTRNGIDPLSIQSVLELGCGVGRVTVHLASQFSRVIGVDISPGHLEAARQAATSFEKTNIELVHLPRIEAVHDLPRVDCLYTVIVLQHNPPPVIRVMLEGLLDRVNPGGIAYFQVPVLTPGYKYHVAEHLNKGGEDIEQHAIPQRVVFEILRKYGYEVLEVLPDTWVSLPTLSCSFLARREKGI